MFLVAVLVMAGTGSVAFLLGGRTIEFTISLTITIVSVYILRRGARERTWD